MAQLIVGGVTIPVARGNASRDRDDFTDRRRAFDGTYRASQTGGAARTWRFRTPPITRVLSDTYEATLGIVAAQMCSGDLLGIPTMCCAQIDSGWNAIKAASGHYVELPFTLHEVQPAKLLLKYAPGDTITGESFSRSTIGTYFNINGILVDAAINAKRDSHYGSYPSGTTRMTLLEDARTNHILWCNDFSNAAWTKSTMSVGTGIAGMRVGAQACTLTATASDAYVQQVPAAGASAVRTNSIWVRRRTGTGQVELYAADGSTFQVLSLTASFQRVRITGPANTGRQFLLLIRTSGDAIDVENAQVEDGAFASSEILTTTVAVTRGADSYSLPFTTPPQEMTVYAKFVEGGSVLTAGARVFEFVNSAAGADPRFLVQSSPTVYSFYHNNGVSFVNSPQLAGGSSLGDTVELNTRLFGDGSVDATQSLNAAAATTSGQSSALALAAAWSGQLAWLNSEGTGAGVGFTALQSFKIVAGARSLTEMRTL